MSELIEALCSVVGDSHVLQGQRLSERASHFWNPAPLQALALVRPADTESLRQCVALCHKAGQRMVTHGGITGLVGGDRSRPDDVVISLERMRAVEHIDPVGRTITVEAGCILETVQNAAQEAGLQFGLDLGARGSCTIGGNISTNAGGLSVLRYGMMREQVLGLEVVLADGTLMSSMNSLLKNNAGYDLKHLFIGSEGTLGIVTRAVLRLRAPTPSVQTALLGFERYEQVTDTLAHMDVALNGQLNAFEVIWQPFFRLNTDPAAAEYTPAPMARDYPLYAVVESRGSDERSNGETFQQAMEQAVDQGLIVDGVVAQSHKERRTIWAIRETVSNAGRGPRVFVYDVSLPIAAMDQYVAALDAQLQSHWPDTQFYAYGHIADGNIHLQIVPPLDAGNPDVLDSARRRVNTMVYEPLQPLRGSISAEHGIGIDKREYLPLSRSSVELSMMRALKQQLDPEHLLNPGKVI